LDGLRALAFLMVFFHHYDGLVWGWAGVDLFFVLSGFLITGILYDTQHDPYRARNFYLRRTLRIFPLYYGIMLAIALLYPVFHWRWSWAWLVWPLYVGNFARFAHPYLPGSPLQLLADFQPNGTFAGDRVVLFLGHFWSLCVEEQFYLIWPWVVFWVRDRRKLAWICAAALPICLGLRVLGYYTLPHWIIEAEVLYRATPLRLDALLLGGLLALLLRGSHANTVLRSARIAGPAAAIAMALVAVLLPSTRIWAKGYSEPAWRFSWGLTLVDLLAALLILLALQPGSFIYRIFTVQPLPWLGRISYGLYVFHDIPHMGIRGFVDQYHLAHPRTATMLIAFPTTILLAWLSFRFFETPFLNLKERWTVHGVDDRLQRPSSSPAGIG
jgi:peptidoglycan/LPS O-acetylase OafA/YrhL